MGNRGWERNPSQMSRQCSPPVVPLTETDHMAPNKSAASLSLRQSEENDGQPWASTIRGIKCKKASAQTPQPQTGYVGVWKGRTLPRKVRAFKKALHLFKKFLLEGSRAAWSCLRHRRRRAMT